MAVNCALLAATLLLGTAACDRSSTAPKVPLKLSASARRVDGSALPALIEERSNEASYLTGYTITLTPDGFWRAEGTRSPVGTLPSEAMTFEDNGFYQFDGTTLRLHSNFSHTDWPSSLRGDTLTSTMMLPTADAPHAIVMW